MMTERRITRRSLLKRLSIALLLGLVLSGLNCAPPADQPNIIPPEESQTPPKPGYPVVVRDELNREVTFPSPPKRIVSLSPSNTELLFALELNQQIVGVTNYCNFPPEAEQKEKIGDFNANSISLERIVALKPDLVVTGAGFHQSVIEALERNNVTALAIEPENFSGIYHDIELLGKVCDRHQQADQLVASMKSRIETIVQQAKTKKTDPLLKVFYQIWDDPISSTGNVSFIGEMMEMVQVENIFAELETGYAPVSEEVLIQKNPDVILVPEYHGGGADREKILNRNGWAKLNAVKNDRIVFLPDDEVSRYGPRIVEGLEAIYQACYPDQPVSQEKSP